MPDLRTRFGTGAAGISYAISVSKVGAMTGSLLAGLLDRYGEYYDVMCGSLVSVMALSAVLKTSSTHLWLFTVCGLLDEFCWGMLGPGSDSMVIALWGVRASPYIQALHLGFPIGGTVGPLVASLFVSHNSTLTNASTNTFMGAEDDSYYDPFVLNSVLKSDVMEEYENEDRFPDDSQIQYAFYIAACLLLTASVGFFVFYILFNKNTLVNIKKSSFKWQEIFSPSEWTEGEKWLGVGLLVCMIIFFTAHDNQYNVISIYISSYAVDSGLGFTNQEAARLSSLLHFTGSLGRFLGIFTSNCIATKILFSFHTNAGAVSFLLLALFGPTSKTYLFIFVALFGFLFRPIRGFTYGFLNFYMLMIANIYGLMRFGTNFMSIFLQALHGYLYDATVIEVIFYIGVIYGCVYVIVHVFMLLLGRSYGTLEYRRQKKSDNTASKIVTECGVENSIVDSQSTNEWEKGIDLGAKTDYETCFNKTNETSYL